MAIASVPFLIFCMVTSPTTAGRKTRVTGNYGRGQAIGFEGWGAGLELTSFPLISRFAPAPTGYLHLGHVLNAIHVWDFARAHGGRVLLRIEDHDRQRSRPEFEDAIREDLAWLGFEPDAEVPRQSERGDAYRSVLAGLVNRGLVYGCACTRQEIASTTQQPNDELRYLGTCRDLGLGLRDDLGWRVRMEPGVETFVDDLCGPQSQDPSQQCGDLLIRDRKGNWTYQWAATIDDALQGITHVIRGLDLLPSTGRQIRLARLSGRVTPATFRHHPLIMKSATQKLSKSDRDTGVRDLRAAGWSAADVRRAASRRNRE
jgi:glutamyl-tRNA synthetase/glutamyl-Q tRNA(Asp) synthetase